MSVLDGWWLRRVAMDRPAWPRRMAARYRLCGYCNAAMSAQPDRASGLWLLDGQRERGVLLRPETSIAHRPLSPSVLRFNQCPIRHDSSVPMALPTSASRLF